MPSMSRLFAFLVLAAVRPMPASAESWYPLAVGNTWEFAYRNTVAYNAPGGMTNVTEGRMTMRIEAKEVLHGKEYHRALTDYHGLFGIEPASIWLREDAEGVYSAMIVNGSWREMRALRLPIELGKPWDYDDGEPSTRVADAFETIRQGDSAHADALRVRRIFSNPEKEAIFQHSSWYAKGKGEVRFVMKQESGPMLSLTETILTSFTAGAKTP